MIFSQIAIYIPNHELYKNNFSKIFGSSMYTDVLRMKGIFNRVVSDDVDLKLSFNHSIMNGVEIEYITSKSKYHWHAAKISKNPFMPFLSHLGVYCNDGEIEVYYSKLMKLKVPILQDSISYDHSNKRTEDGDGPSSRHYRDVIFDTESLIGFNIKLSSKI